ncbi:MAG: aminotransferase class V-fold PLP-dependent enzyme [Candidatus Nanohaloarchaea archaeon]
MKAEELKQDFPALDQEVNGKRIVYLDNAATTQKPESVIQRIEKFYREENANEGRSLHTLANRATTAYESSRRRVADFIGAGKEELVFVRNTTEAMNLLAETLELDGKIVIPEMAHHSEMLPWRRKAEKEGLEIEYIPTKDHELDMEAARDIIDEDTAMVSVSHVSNVFGCRNPVKELAGIAHENDAWIAVDAAQSAAREKIDVKEMDADFLALSGHKMAGPTGIGALYGRKELLEQMEPYQVGGGMIRKVTGDEVEYGNPPGKFEAGTPNIGGAVGLSAAIDYLEEIGVENIGEHERELNRKMVEGLEEIDGVTVYAAEEPAVVSFTSEHAHPHDVAEVLNSEGIAVRAGHHCAQPQMESLGINGTVRASPFLYNTRGDVERLVEAVKEVRRVF